MGGSETASVVSDALYVLRSVYLPGRNKKGRGPGNRNSNKTRIRTREESKAENIQRTWTDATGGRVLPDIMFWLSSPGLPPLFFSPSFLDIGC